MLAGQVDWQAEQSCFEGIALELSLFYSDFCAYYEPMEGGKDEVDEGEGDDKKPQAEEGETGPVPVKYERLLQVRKRAHAYCSLCHARS